MSPEQWDEHWYRIREDYLVVGFDERAATDLADVDCVAQFGPRPTEETRPANAVVSAPQRGD